MLFGKLFRYLRLEINKISSIKFFILLKAGEDLGETLPVVENDLYPMVNAVGATRNILKTAEKTFEQLEDFVTEANEKINSINLLLKSLQEGHAQLKDDYFSKFNKAKSELRQVRNRIRQLADRTTTETRDLKVLLEALDESDDTFLLKAAIEKMKTLMVLSKDALIEAEEKYYQAIETFENLNSSIQLDAGYIKKLADTESAEYNEYKTKVRLYTATSFGVAEEILCTGICRLKNLFTLNGLTANLTEAIGFSLNPIDSLKFAIERYAPLVDLIVANTAYAAEVEKLITLTGDMLVSGQKIDKTIKEGIAFLTDETALLNRWSNNVDAVSKNIDSYPQEYLKKIKAIRTIFINKLNDLQTTACEFLNRGELFENNANTINIPELCRG